MAEVETARGFVSLSPLKPAKVPKKCEAQLRPQACLQRSVNQSTGPTLRRKHPTFHQPCIFSITSSCSDNYDDAFPASQTSHCGINSRDNKHLVEFYKKCPGCVETRAANHVGGHFFFSRLRCIAVDAKCGLCAIASSSREESR